MRRVGHFQLTLNNPGLGYKEQGPSAPPPSARHLPQPLHTPQEPGLPSPKVSASHPKPCAPSCCKREVRSKAYCLLRGQEAPRARLLTHRTVCHPPGPGLVGLGAGLGPPTQLQKTPPLSETEGLDSQTDPLQSPFQLEIP